MNRIKIKNCILQEYKQVVEHNTPSLYPKNEVFIIFTNTETPAFNGLVTRHDILTHTHHTFKSLLKDQNKYSIKANTDAEAALAFMEKIKRDTLPVFDDKDNFLGITTKTNILLKLYQNERTQLIKSKENNLIQNQKIQTLLKKFAISSKSFNSHIDHTLLLDKCIKSSVENTINTIIAEKPNDIMAVMLINIYNFQEISAKISYFFAQLLLKQISAKIHSTLNVNNIISHKSQSGFVILLCNINFPYEAVQLAKLILDVLKSPFEINAKLIHVKACIGISLYPQDSRSAPELLNYANIALNNAKKTSSHRVQLFEKNMYFNLNKLEKMEELLHKALKCNEFLINYQPLINIKNKNNLVIGMEALIRWNSPELGLILPNYFINIAEKNGIIIPIDRWMMSMACQQIVHWQEANKPLRISVNLSGLNFKANYNKQDSLIEYIKSILQHTKLNPELLELELTENILIENNNDAALNIMKEIKNLGVRLSCDDFGTGYSSLAYLKKFPIDTIKIDQSFIKNISKSPIDLAIVSAIITMAKTISIDIVAEGVENQEQLLILKDLGCDVIQGYCFSKAIPANEMDLFLKNNL